MSEDQEIEGLDEPPGQLRKLAEKNIEPAPSIIAVPSTLATGPRNAHLDAVIFARKTTLILRYENFLVATWAFATKPAVHFL